MMCRLVFLLYTTKSTEATSITGEAETASEEPCRQRYLEFKKIAIYKST